ncbi:hypothetical protein LCGC14_0870850 [marine sediment metagenome]|uniref:Glutaredoxin domain-containing protein n=1 Tax=marine sediment metagenome TaxID=412755 RepID=A0A0F9RPH0_9ZZZZ
MTVRIISSINCSKCKGYLERLDKRGYNYSAYNADDPKNQQQLDEWKVRDMPVIQIINGDKVMYQFPPGTYSPRLLEQKIEDLKGD